MSTGIISISVSGIRAAQQALLVTSHNVTNASTDGYSRQRTIQATNTAINTGSGSIGQGTHVVTVERLYDKYLSGQVNSAQTQVSYLDSLYSQLSQIDSMLADADAGLSPALQDFFSGVQQVASDPSLLEGRQVMITSAQTLVARFQNLDSRLSEIASEVDSRIVDTVDQINTYASQLADINKRIITAQAGTGQPANDLLDQRDQLVAELNKYIKVSTTTSSDGSYNVFIGNGQQLVIGGRAMEMTATPSRADSSKVAIGLMTQGGPIELPEKLIVGGELGGLLEFRSQSLDAVTNELGRVATSLALTFNAQYSLGQDLLGNIEGDTGFVGSFFSVPDPKILSNTANTGSGSLTATFATPSSPSAPDYTGSYYTDLTSSDYQVTFGAAGAYTVTRLTDKEIVASGTGTGSVTFDGLSLNIGAVGASGDKFTIKPVAEAARNIDIDSRIANDPRLINASAPVRATQTATNTGSMTVSQGIVGTGYSTAGLPATLTASASDISGVPGTWTAVYSDGTTASGTGNVALTSGSATLSTIAFAGMSFSVKGTPNAGDSFVIERNDGGVQDGRNAVLLGKLQTSNTMAGGTATFQSVYARLVSENGIKTRSAQVQLAAQEAMLAQAQSTRDAYSAVNLDEEAANLLKFQQAYQASAKALEIGSKLFDTILGIF